MWVLGIKPRSSGRAVFAFNCSPALQPLIFFFFFFFFEAGSHYVSLAALNCLYRSG